MKRIHRKNAVTRSYQLMSLSGKSVSRLGPKIRNSLANVAKQLQYVQSNKPFINPTWLTPDRNTLLLKISPDIKVTFTKGVNNTWGDELNVRHTLKSSDEKIRPDGLTWTQELNNFKIVTFPAENGQHSYRLEGYIGTAKTKRTVDPDTTKETYTPEKQYKAPPNSLMPKILHKLARNIWEAEKNRK